MTPPKLAEKAIKALAREDAIEHLELFYDSETILFTTFGSRVTAAMMCRLLAMPPTWETDVELERLKHFLRNEAKE
jgi:hypothetical protein